MAVKGFLAARAAPHVPIMTPQAGGEGKSIRGEDAVTRYLLPDHPWKRDRRQAMTALDSVFTFELLDEFLDGSIESCVAGCLTQALNQPRTSSMLFLRRPIPF
jgi:hypothetical protein